MSISLELQGFDAVEALLAKWEALLQSGHLWRLTTLAAAEEFQRYAMSISPVITGAYRGSHIIISQRMATVMTIDSGAINPVSGDPVTRYAGDVEDHHGVYQRTFNQASGRAGALGVEVMLERLG